MSQVKDYMLKEFGANHKYKKAEYEQISKLFDISVKTLAVYACKIRKEHGTKDERIQIINQIKELRDVKTKWSRIAEMMNLSEDNVKKIYQRSRKEDNNGN